MIVLKDVERRIRGRVRGWQVEGPVPDVFDPAEAEELFDIRNLVVTNFYRQGLHLVAGQDLTAAAINRMGLGIGTADLAVSNTGLVWPGGSEVSSSISSVTYTETPVSVTFNATFGTSQANGNEYTELGLLLAGASPNLAARIVFPATRKHELFSWVFEWTLQWS